MEIVVQKEMRPRGGSTRVPCCAAQQGQTQSRLEKGMGHHPCPGLPFLLLRLGQRAPGHALALPKARDATLGMRGEDGGWHSRSHVPLARLPRPAEAEQAWSASSCAACPSIGEKLRRDGEGETAAS